MIQNITLHAMNRGFLLFTVVFSAGLSTGGIAIEPRVPTLTQGSKGNHVAFAQTLLNANSGMTGMTLIVDGDFGAKTTAALKQFQKTRDLPVDGVIGPVTWGKLRGMGVFIYDQSTGNFGRSQITWATGYSGKGKAKNDPRRETLKSLGPIPRGKWIIGHATDSKTTGPFVLPLSPKDHNAHGRTAFQIHGDSSSNPGDASNGCIVLPRHIREHIAASGEIVLHVVE